MQSSNGGWGAFDVDNDAYWLYKIPFCDFGAVIDPPSVDVTAHVVELLAREAGYEDAVRRGVDYLLASRRRTARGSGAGASTTSTAPARCCPRSRPPAFAPDHPAIRRAVAWLEAHQNEDGGFGEDCRSYDAGEAGLAWRGRGESTPSQTAWALLGLVAAGEARSDCAAARRRLARASASGRTAAGTRSYFTGTGFPRDFLIRYHLYRIVWPVMALGRVAPRPRAREGLRHGRDRLRRRPRRAGAARARAPRSRTSASTCSTARACARAVEGCDAVVHVAALYSYDAPGRRLRSG